MNNAEEIKESWAWKQPREAFEQAILDGRLSRDAKAKNFAGHYMYMGPTVNHTGDAFKHIITRQYLPLKGA